MTVSDAGRPTVVALRRYPVKSMGGEALRSVELDARGLVGDRWYAVEDEDGRFASGKDSRRFRRRDTVFEHAARTTDSGEVVVSSGMGTWAVGDAALDAELSTVMEAAVRVLPETTVGHQDQGAVSLVGTATLAWCAERWGLEAGPRRLRVNVVVDTDEPFVEETWVGRSLTVGSVGLRVVERVPRCRMVDVAQDGTSAEGSLLKHLGAERDLCLAVYADVETPGVLAVGESLHLA